MRREEAIRFIQKSRDWTIIDNFTAELEEGNFIILGIIENGKLKLHKFEREENCTLVSGSLQYADASRSEEILPIFYRRRDAEIFLEDYDANVSNVYLDAAVAVSERRTDEAVSAEVGAEAVASGRGGGEDWCGGHGGAVGVEELAGGEEEVGFDAEGDFVGEGREVAAAQFDLRPFEVRFELGGFVGVAAQDAHGGDGDVVAGHGVGGVVEGVINVACVDLAQDVGGSFAPGGGGEVGGVIVRIPHAGYAGAELQGGMARRGADPVEAAEVLAVDDERWEGFVEENVVAFEVSVAAEEAFDAERGSE